MCRKRHRHRRGVLARGWEDLQLGACQFTGTEEKVKIISRSTTADGTEEKKLKLILSTIGFCQSVLSASVLFQDDKTEIRRSFKGGKQQVIY